MRGTLSLPMRGLVWLTCISFTRRTMASSPRSMSRQNRGVEWGERGEVGGGCQDEPGKGVQGG